ncbi:hypothetical protein GCK32_004970 [Trichostrongylus colubriformis]|uniref:Uncharacterized protein n=1 Tax=Trichostrongylus colubriformis TaxID=6319 RepID=A0AAN8FKV6_TRICO
MHYSRHHESVGAFSPSTDLYGFSGNTSKRRTPTVPAFDIPPETTAGEDPKKLSKFYCNCRYLWLRELHGLSTTMMSNSLEEKLFWSFVIVVCGLVSVLNANAFLGNYYDRSTTLITFVPVKQITYPALVFCPKNADGLRYDILFEDFVANVGLVNISTADSVIQYVIAGSGFDNVDVSQWTDAYKVELNTWYDKWRGNRTVLEMFDFIFNQNGYRCDEFFDTCWAGSQVLDCCEVFKPTYVMLRGRCFRLTDNYNQTDVDENSKLSIRLNNVQKGTLSGRKNKTQVVMYMGDAHPEVGIYPRVYLNYHDWNRIRFIQRRLSMLSNNPQCSMAPRDQGKSTCFVYNWLMRVVVNPLNCTVPYFKGMLQYVDDVATCDPLAIVNDYARITSTMLEPYHYESYSEIRLTTPAGFISELGGQSGLFVGCSVMSFVQLILSILSLFVICARKIYVRYFSLALSIDLNAHKNPKDSIPVHDSSQ